MLADRITPAQIKTIHTLRRQIVGFEDGDYRGLLATRFNVASSRDLSDRSARRLIDELRKLGARPSARATGPFVAKLRALWLSAYNLGVVRAPDDRAMLKFIQRQTGVEHTRFLIYTKDASRAIEALKSWLTREAGVAWPASRDPLALKRAIVDAQAARIRSWLPTFDANTYGLLEGLPSKLECYGEAHMDRLCDKLGRMIRERKGG